MTFDAALVRFEFEEAGDSVQAEKKRLEDARNFFKKAGNGIPENSEKAKGQEK